MICNTNGTVINPMQLLRLQEHSIQIEDGLIPIDNLEEGVLKIYEHTGGSLNYQQLFTEDNNCTNAALIAKITIGNASSKGSIGIEEIFCSYGYEKLVYPMICQVVAFAKFYENIQSVRIAESERENWFIHAGGVLQDFCKKNEGYCEYRIK